MWEDPLRLEGAVGHYTERPVPREAGEKRTEQARGHQGDEMRGLIREERAPVVKPPVEVLPTVALTGSQMRATFISTALALAGSVALLGGPEWWRRRFE